MEGKADDLRQEFQAMPSHSHLVNLDNPTLVKFGQGLKKMPDVPQDIGEVNQTLDAFNKHGSKLADNLKDFSQHPSFAHVQQALQPHIEKAALKAQKKQAGVAGEETIHDDGQGTVVKEIHTPEAASQPKYCDGTAWCVSRQGESGKGYFNSYRGNGGTGKNGTARMFVIHTPDNELYAYHEGERHEDQPGIIRNKHDRAVSIPDFIDKYPQVSHAKELQNTKHGEEFKPPKEINSPEDISEVLDNQKSSFGTIKKAFESRHFGPEHMNKLLSHKMLDSSNAFYEYNGDDGYNPNYELAHDAINSKHFKPEHLDNIVNEHIKSHLLKHVPVNKFTPAHIDKFVESQESDWGQDPWGHKELLADLVERKAPAIQPHHIDKILNLPTLPGKHVDYTLNRLRHNAIKHPYFSQEHLNSIINDPDKHHLLGFISDKLTSDHTDKFLESPNFHNISVLSDNPNLIEPHHIDKILDIQGDNKSHFFAPSEEKEQKDFYLKNAVGYLHHAILNRPDFSEKHLDKAINKHMETGGNQYSREFAHKIIAKKSENNNNFFGDVLSNPNLTFDKKIPIIMHYPEGELQSHHIESILNNPNSEYALKTIAINSRNVKQHHLDNIINNPEKHDQGVVDFAKDRRYALNAARQQ